MMAMKRGDRARWIDPVSKRIKSGVLIEWFQVVSESNEIKNIDDPYEPLKFKDVEYKEWNVKCDQDGKIYSFPEHDLEVFKAN